MAPNKSIVGEAVFTHESGIHVDGLLKNPRNYEGFSPSEVGRQHSTVLGKHSGVRAVRATYAKLGLTLTETEAQQVLVRVRAHAVLTKRSPDSEDLARFFLESVASSATLV